MSKPRLHRLLPPLASLTAVALGPIVGLGGCATPAPYQAVNHLRVVPLTPPEVWRRLHAFLQDQNIAVRREDVQAGLIDARQEVAGQGLLTSYADCGGGGLSFGRAQRRQVLDLTVRVHAAPDGSQVTVEAGFSQTLQSRGRGAVTVACRSTGVLEDAILEVASGQPMQAAVIPR